jgi:hypothetical protein
VKWVVGTPGVKVISEASADLQWELRRSRDVALVEEAMEVQHA